MFIKGGDAYDLIYSLAVYRADHAKMVYGYRTRVLSGLCAREHADNNIIRNVPLGESPNEGLVQEQKKYSSELGPE